MFVVTHARYSIYCVCVTHLIKHLSVYLQVSESGKALLDVLQRCPTTDPEDTKPDFTAATHSIMAVLHQVMQVCPTVIAMEWQKQHQVANKAKTKTHNIKTSVTTWNSLEKQRKLKLINKKQIPGEIGV